jgi:MATE family multidrug resistance protein
MSEGTFGHSVSRIVPLAWPVAVGQVAMLSYATLDTLLMARQSATELAALAVGSAVYVTVFVGLMGVLLAVGPIVGQLFGAQRLHDAGHQAWQALWLALAMAALGAVLLAFPGPILALAQASGAVEDKVRGYLLALAFALPASLLLSVFRGFNNAVSRPRVAMVLQVGGLAVKLPLSWVLATGGGLGLPAMGVQGCGIATAVAMWCQAAVALWWLRRDPFYQRFAFGAPGQRRLQPGAVLAMLRLGLPMGLSIAVEVTGFVFMAIFIARMGDTAVAGHQIATNLVSMMFMVPLGLATATTTLVAQRLGAGDLGDAQRLGWHGLGLGLVVALVLGSLVFAGRQSVIGLYTANAAVAAAALPLLAWVALFHTADAVQTMAAFTLRAWRVATLPMVIYVLALWGVGLGGGHWLAFGDGPLAGAHGFWAASTTGLTVAALGGARGQARRPPRRPAPEPSRPRRRGRRAAGCAAQPAGRLSTKALPPPSRGSQRTLPPWAAAICLTRLRPRPTPPSRSAWPGRRT